MILDDIYNVILDSYGIDIKRDTKEQEVVDFRYFFFMAVRRHDNRIKDGALGRYAGRDRTTVTAAWRKIKELLKTNRAFRVKSEIVQERIDAALDDSLRPSEDRIKDLINANKELRQRWMADQLLIHELKQIINAREL